MPGRRGFENQTCHEKSINQAVDGPRHFIRTGGEDLLHSLVQH